MPAAQGTLKALATEQSLAGSYDFTGAAPSGTEPDPVDRVVSWPEGAADGCGLFNFATWSDLTIVDQIRVHLTGGSDYAIYIQNAAGTRDFLIQSGTGLSDVNVVYEGPLRLTKGEKIKITTAGAAGLNGAYAKVIHRFWERASGY
jgi:hypothetical protein